MTKRLSDQVIGNSEKPKSLLKASIKFKQIR